MTVEQHRGGHGYAPPAWSEKPIRDLPAEELVAALRYLEAADTRDEILVRALQTELTLRQAGIRPRATNAALDRPEVAKRELADFSRIASPS